MPNYEIVRWKMVSGSQKISMMPVMFCRRDRCCSSRLAGPSVVPSSSRRPVFPARSSRNTSSPHSMRTWHHLSTDIRDPYALSRSEPLHQTDDPQVVLTPQPRISRSALTRKIKSTSLKTSRCCDCHSPFVVLQIVILSRSRGDTMPTPAPDQCASARLPLVPLAESSRPRSVSTHLRTFAVVTQLHSSSLPDAAAIAMRIQTCQVFRRRGTKDYRPTYGQNHRDSPGPNLDCTCNKERPFSSPGTALLSFHWKDPPCLSATPLRCLVHLSTTARNNALTFPMFLLSPRVE